MSTTNLWKRLKQLLPDAPLLAGKIIAVYTYGALVELPDGSHISVRGSGDLNSFVFVRDGLIEGPAPSFVATLIEI